MSTNDLDDMLESLVKDLEDRLTGKMEKYVKYSAILSEKILEVIAEEEISLSEFKEDDNGDQFAYALLCVTPAYVLSRITTMEDLSPAKIMTLMMQLQMKYSK